MTARSLGASIQGFSVQRRIFFSWQEVSSVSVPEASSDRNRAHVVRVFGAKLLLKSLGLNVVGLKPFGGGEKLWVAVLLYLAGDNCARVVDAFGNRGGDDT